MHFCSLNWSPWSRLMETDEKLLVQTRLCKVCRRMNTRKAPNLNGLNVDEINKALDSVQAIKQDDTHSASVAGADTEPAPDQR